MFWTELHNLSLMTHTRPHAQDNAQACVGKWSLTDNAVSLIAGAPGTTGYVDDPNGLTARFYLTEGKCFDFVGEGGRDG